MNRKSRGRLLALVVLVAGGWLAVVWLTRSPSNERLWAPDHAVLAAAEFDGSLVHVSNIRDFRHPETGDSVPAYYDRTFDLDAIETLWLVLTPFRAERRGMAHLFLSFGFATGEFVAISVEARKELGERYSSWKGLFRGYELIYVIADERDLIQRRANRAGKNVYLYPLRSPAERVRRLFVEMLQRANELRAKPEFYNTLTASCSRVVLRHANSVAAREIPGGLRIILPGYADSLVHELGLLDSRLSLEESRRKYMISELSRRFADAPDYSLRIREFGEETLPVSQATPAAEKIFHAYRESLVLWTAIAEVWHGRDRSHILATVLCIGLAFTGYNLFSAINGRLANGRLARWLLGRAASVSDEKGSGESGG